MATMFSLVSNAQTTLQTPKLFDNTYIGITGGVSTNMDFNCFTPFNYSVGLRAGKELTPVFGIQVEELASFTDNFMNDSKNFIRFVNTEFNGTINWSNLLFGYKGSSRTFEVRSVTGLGWLVFFKGERKYLDDSNEVSAKTALDLTYNINPAWRVYVQPGVYWNLTSNDEDKIQFNKHGAYIAVMVGVDYKFKISNKTHSFRY